MRLIDDACVLAFMKSRLVEGVRVWGVTGWRWVLDMSLVGMADGRVFLSGYNRDELGRGDMFAGRPHFSTPEGLSGFEAVED